jgi:hypothetical protein
MIAGRREPGTKGDLAKNSFVSSLSSGHPSSRISAIPGGFCKELFSCLFFCSFNRYLFHFTLGQNSF